jgi:hypothetical protein
MELNYPEQDENWIQFALSLSAPILFIIFFLAIFFLKKQQILSDDKIACLFISTSWKF